MLSVQVGRLAVHITGHESTQRGHVQALIGYVPTECLGIKRVEIEKLYSCAEKAAIA